MFKPTDVAEYYNTTLNHYERWWNLRSNLSLHYGIWEKDTKDFTESLVNTNRVLAELSGIGQEDHVLDAGCGVGGAAMYIVQTQHACVTGITLSQKQAEYATRMAKEHQLEDKVSFHVMDYTETSFENESFDVIWACESVSSAPDKSAFIKEAYRLLKRGGRLVMSDFFITKDQQEDKNQWIRKWLDTWGISNLVTSEYFVNELEAVSFTVKQNMYYTDKIRKSAKRLYNTSLMGALLSVMYNLTHPNVSRFAKTHYKCGYYQWKALKAGLWKYGIIFAVKA